jgi:hypothetical protein
MCVCVCARARVCVCECVCVCVFVWYKKATESGTRTIKFWRRVCCVRARVHQWTRTGVSKKEKNRTTFFNICRFDNSRFHDGHVSSRSNCTTKNSNMVCTPESYSFLCVCLIDSITSVFATAMSLRTIVWQRTQIGYASIFARRPWLEKVLRSFFFFRLYVYFWNCQHLCKEPLTVEFFIIFFVLDIFK